VVGNTFPRLLAQEGYLLIFGPMAQKSQLCRTPQDLGLLL
jgi:hypothetical protein